jgi:hypothetical protein
MREARAARPPWRARQRDRVGEKMFGQRAILRRESHVGAGLSHGCHTGADGQSVPDFLA